MAKLLITINLIYFIFLLGSVLFFSYQYYNGLIEFDTFTKVSGVCLASILILLFSYKQGSKYFSSTAETIGIHPDTIMPTIIFLFLGSVSMSIAVVFLSILEAFGILFVLESLNMLILNILAFLAFLWLAFVLILGWDIFKVLGIVTQYSMLKDIENGKKPSLIRSMSFAIRKIRRTMDVITAFVAIDMACKYLPKGERNTYKHLIYPIKIWTACLTICKYENIYDSLKESFSFYKNKNFESFYSSHLAAFFLPMMIIPVGLSLGIIVSNLEYFSSFACLSNNCIFMIIFFLIFMALGFFFSYSLGASFETAYYVKILRELENTESLRPKKDRNIKIIENKTFEKLEKLKGSFFDVFKVYFD